MKRRSVYIVIFIVAILGLFFIQYKYLKIGVSLATVQFKKNIDVASKNIKNDLADENQLTFLVGKAITNDDTNFKLSIDSIQDASKYFLKDFISYRLKLNGIDTDFSYRLIAKDSSFSLKSPNQFNTSENLLTFPIQLKGYLPETAGKDTLLELQFKNINSYLLSQLNGLTIPSLLFMLIIIIIFIWFLRSIYWQRQVITTTNSFINNLTHELKTPVFSINLASKMLEKDLDTTKKPLLKIIRQQTERLNKHIDKVLELGKLEFQPKLFNLKKTDFKPNLIEICQNFETLSNLNNITFTYNLEEGSFLIKSEINHLENAISNILDNAQKYSENPIIKLNASKHKNQLLISISDNGVGINKKDKDLIFKKYYRVSNEDVHKVKGYGLGLSYVKEVVKKHKGKVKIDSNVGVGTIVTIFIPLIHEK
ncbi:two-component system, OmpR family, phosphate regulon sensor histidine kinase PhoR [Flaviramulus basaltis]|uniref:histidine kinase n=1 Tax=Flaviramulus basaltis TaxID=369401 RepID=A0A1K2IC18_9FLAO|nr:HAMP domain-containing sensor histidine kinase [Flaviramulus basaltis]SFZ89943.1 two-component system, OmpR family, phosphate regulon sensor histidine kinase PhoR [Flaviramulus basaltis]